MPCHAMPWCTQNSNKIPYCAATPSSPTSTTTRFPVSALSMACRRILPHLGYSLRLEQLFLELLAHHAFLFAGFPQVHPVDGSGANPNVRSKGKHETARSAVSDGAVNLNVQFVETSTQRTITARFMVRGRDSVVDDQDIWTNSFEVEHI